MDTRFRKSCKIKVKVAFENVWAHWRRFVQQELDEAQKEKDHKHCSAQQAKRDSGRFGFNSNKSKLPDCGCRRFGRRSRSVQAVACGGAKQERDCICVGTTSPSQTRKHAKRTAFENGQVAGT